MRRFLRSSTKPAASRNRPLRAVPTTASQFAPVWGRTAAAAGAAVEAAAASGFASCTTFWAAAGVTAACLPVQHQPARGVRGHRGRGAAVRLFGGIRGAGRVRGIVARHVRFTGFRGQFGQHHMLGLAALVNAADVVCIAVLFQRGLHDLAGPAASRAGPRPSAC